MCGSANVSIICSLIVAVTSIIGSVVLLKNSRHSVMASAITAHRMKWIGEVRDIMTDFCETFRKNRADTEKLKSLRTRLFLHLRDDNKDYEPLVRTVNRCCDRRMSDRAARLALDDLTASAQYVLAVVWARVKIEGAKGYGDDRKIEKMISANYKEPRLKLDMYYEPSENSKMAGQAQRRRLRAARGDMREGTQKKRV